MTARRIKQRAAGVVTVSCLMSTLGFADALSQDGVKYLAASPQRCSRGTTTSVAEDIAKHIDDPAAMAKAIVKDTMSTKYGIGGMAYKPAAAKALTATVDVLKDRIEIMSVARGEVAPAAHASGDRQNQRHQTAARLVRFKQPGAIRDPFIIATGSTINRPTRSDWNRRLGDAHRAALVAAPRQVRTVLAPFACTGRQDPPSDLYSNALKASFDAIVQRFTFAGGVGCKSYLLSP